MIKRARSDDYNYDWLTDEEYEALDWDASLTLNCHVDDTHLADMVSAMLHQRGYVSTPDGFSVLPVDADLALHMRAVSVRELNEKDIADLDLFFHRLPWDHRNLVKMIIHRNDVCTWEFGFS